MSLFRERKDLVVKVFLAGDEDEPFICAVNGECSISALTEIEESLFDEEHEFSSGPGEYVYEAAYDDGQWCLETGRCEIAPYWELTEIGFEKPDWMSMTHEPEKHGEPATACDTCGDTDIACLCCIPF